MSGNRGYSRRELFRYLLITPVVGSLSISAGVRCRRDDGSEYHGWERTDDPRRDADATTIALWTEMAPQSGMTVVDVGAGAGYFTFRLAKAVAPEGIVHATDSARHWVDHIDSHATMQSVTNVRAHHVRFPETSGLEGVRADLVVMINSFALTTRVEMGPGCGSYDKLFAARALAGILREGGRLVYMPDPSVKALADAKTAEELLRSGGFNGAIRTIVLPESLRRNERAFGLVAIR